MMVIENKYEIGQMVYLITDSDQNARMIVSIEVFKIGEILYKINRGSDSSYHYDFEISEVPNELLKVK